MKLIFVFFYILTINISFAYTNKDCIKLHSTASYALAHAKKSLHADNFDHQRYYAERAIEALKKAQDYNDDCNCTAVNKIIEEGIKNLIKAAEAEDWEKGRFYSKKGYADTQNLINAIEECTTNNKSYNSNNTSSIDNNSVSSDTSTSIQEKEQALLIEQQKIIAAQKKLEEEQKRLNEQLAHQRKIQQELEAKKLIEFNEQLKTKEKTEKALKNFENAIMLLTQTLDCKEAYTVIANSYIKNEETLKKETLTDTKKFYLIKAKEIAEKALANLEDCNSY